ncbi:MAG: polysaccharide deacetylase family protein [Butyricicoccus sp.]
MKKYILLICNIAMVLVLAGLFWNQSAHQADVTRQLQQDKETLAELEREQEELENQLHPQRDDESEQETLDKPQILLCFKNGSGVLTEMILPDMEQLGLDAVFLLEPQVLPDDSGVLSTEECKTLLEAGWQCGISMEETEETQYDDTNWETALEEYLDQLKDKLGKRPRVYCFGSGEYSRDREDILRDKGFTLFLIKGGSTDEASAICLNAVDYQYAQQAAAAPSKVALLVDADLEDERNGTGSMVTSGEVEICSPDQFMEKNTVQLGKTEKKRLKTRLAEVEQEIQNIMTKGIENERENGDGS